MSPFLLSSVILVEVLLIVTSLFDNQVNGSPPLNQLASYVDSQKLEQLLIRGIVNKEENVRTITKQFEPNTEQICIPITYNITCLNQSECGNATWARDCESGYEFSFIWTKFNLKTTLGRVLLYYASTGSSVPGFDWGEICRIDYNRIDYGYFQNTFAVCTELFPIIYITVDHLPCAKDTLSGLNRQLQNITTKIARIAESNYTLSSDTEESQGFADNSSRVEQVYREVFVNIDLIAGFCIAVVILSVDGVIHFTIAKITRPNKKHKPKIYYHYWSLISITSFWYFSQRPFRYSNRLIGFLIISTGLLFIIELIIHLFSLILAKRLYTTYTVPFTTLVPTKIGKVVWRYLMTVFSRVIVLLFLAWIIYSTPVILLAYYYSPFRTLLTLFFLAAGIFYTVVLGSNALYQVEKAIEITKFVFRPRNKTIRRKCPPWFSNMCVIDNSSTQLKEDENGTSQNDEKKSLKDRLCPDWTGILDDFLQDEKYNQSFYLNVVKEDIITKHDNQRASNTSWCYFVLVIFSAVGSLVLYIVFTYFIWSVLFDIVIDSSSEIEGNISGILILLPGIAVGAGTWLSKGMYFDTNQDDDNKEHVPFTLKKSKGKNEDMSKLLGELEQLVQLLSIQAAKEASIEMGEADKADTDINNHQEEAKKMLEEAREKLFEKGYGYLDYEAFDDWLVQVCPKQGKKRFKLLTLESVV